eukprot:TRINITY_DN1970_c0_g1_i1.p2 TRINITY_DN1970_c0_g1~~TRINITY_DN1970_c0_g1_i1.p2  ORF type:complete len:466 (-),score=118.57 TRINITY_DN1970_c0_g1_i1:2393-3790(-)
MDPVLQRLEAVTARLEALAAGKGAAPSSSAAAAAAAPSAAGESRTVTEFDQFVADSAKPFLDVSAKIGGDVTTQLAFIQDALQENRKLVDLASKAKKPASLASFVSTLQAKIAAAKDFREKNRNSKQFNHLSAVAEGAGALGWVLIEPTPAPFVDEMLASADFYLNKILREFRGVDNTHVDWVNAFKAMLKGLHAYVKAHHTTGLAWNPKGADAASVSSSSSSSAPAAPPAAPAAPAAPAPSAASSSAAPAANPMALFSQINSGNVTGGLRKVTDDMKAKNRTDRTAVVPAAASAPKAAAAPAGKAPSGPPKCELDGKKWAVENQLNNRSIVIDDTNTKQTVYVYNCQGSLIVVKGKVNNICLDNCKKTSLVFEAVVANCEVVNCTSVEVQVTGKVPSIAIDKCSGIQLYLSADSLDVEIVTAKSDQMNITIPKGEDHHDELPVPEQYKTTIVNGKLVTTIMEHV